MGSVFPTEAGEAENFGGSLLKGSVIGVPPESSFNNSGDTSCSTEGGACSFSTSILSGPCCDTAVGSTLSWSPSVSAVGSGEGAAGVTWLTSSPARSSSAGRQEALCSFVAQSTFEIME